MILKKLKEIIIGPSFEFEERELKVGVLGIGHLGMDCAIKLHQLGFSVFGYSPSLKQTPFPSFSGDELDVFLPKHQCINLYCTLYATYSLPY